MSERVESKTRRSAPIATQPFMVVGTGGSVSIGLVDPLPEIAALCREEDLWFHVDGAYGGFSAASPDAPDDLRALSEADMPT